MDEKKKKAIQCLIGLKYRIMISNWVDLNPIYNNYKFGDYCKFEMWMPNREYNN